jgi:hypothetical protein
MAKRGNKKAPQPASDNYTNWPALKTYIDRIGADQRNFRSYEVREPGRDGYARTIARIKIDDGSVVCDNSAYDPTDEEHKAILEQIKEKPFHKSQPAVNLDKLPDYVKKAPKEHLCIFLDEKGEKILFVQHRKDGENLHTLLVAPAEPGGRR